MQWFCGLTEPYPGLYLIVGIALLPYLLLIALDAISPMNLQVDPKKKTYSSLIDPFKDAFKEP